MWQLDLYSYIKNKKKNPRDCPVYTDQLDPMTSHLMEQISCFPVKGKWTDGGPPCTVTAHTPSTGEWKKEGQCLQGDTYSMRHISVWLRPTYLVTVFDARKSCSYLRVAAAVISITNNSHHLQTVQSMNQSRKRNGCMLNTHAHKHTHKQNKPMKF